MHIHVHRYIHAQYTRHIACMWYALYQTCNMHGDKRFLSAYNVHLLHNSHAWDSIPDMRHCSMHGDKIWPCGWCSCTTSLPAGWSLHSSPPAYSLLFSPACTLLALPLWSPPGFDTLWREAEGNSPEAKKLSCKESKSSSVSVDFGLRIIFVHARHSRSSRCALIRTALVRHFDLASHT